jgi:hypothetical protein
LATDGEIEVGEDAGEEDEIAGLAFGVSRASSP